MEKNELNVTWLFPDVLNLHGDRGNVMAIEKVAKELDLNVNINRIDSYSDKIDFENTDIIIINPGEVKVISKIIEVLKQNKEEMDKFVEANKIIFIVGTSGAIMGKKIKYLDNSEIDGLGYLDMTAVQRETVYGNDILYTLKDDENIEIAGNQIQLMDFSLNSDCSLGNIEYGKGNMIDNVEGAKYKNVIFTNALRSSTCKKPLVCRKVNKTGNEK